MHTKGDQLCEVAFRAKFKLPFLLDNLVPDNVIEKIVEGIMEKYFQEICLLEQPFIKDSDKTVKDLITEAIATLGENITIGRYTRFAIGESHNDS